MKNKKYKIEFLDIEGNIIWRTEIWAFSEESAREFAKLEYMSDDDNDDDIHDIKLTLLYEI